MTHIVAVGLRTSIGLTGASSCAAARAGICRIREHPFFLDPAGEPLRAAYDCVLAPQLLGWQRLLTLAEAGLRQILPVLKLCLSNRKIQFLLALPEIRPGFQEIDKQRILDGLRDLVLREGLPLQISHVGEGHAGALDALRVGRDDILGGKSDLVIIGGVDSYLDADTIQWLGERRQLATRSTRSAFFPGEGAGFVALMSDWLQRTTQQPSLAWIRGAAVIHDRTNKGALPVDPLGGSLTEAIKLATQDLRPGAERIHRVFSDINGERSRSEAWAFAVLRLHELFLNAGEYEAPASSWGDLGAASGAALAAMAVHAWQRGFAPGPLSLLVASSQGGAQGAVLLQQRGWS